MVKRISILVVLALAFVLPVSSRGATQSNWVYLQSGSNLRISIETYRAREGWTPVIVSVAGADVSAVMDGNGRVVHEWAKGQDKRSLPLFTIELDKGIILLGREAHAIVVYEQNPMRMRFRLADSMIQLPVWMDQQGRAGKLRFGGMEIPAQVREADRAVGHPAIKPAGTNLGLAAIRPAVFAAPLLTEKGPRASAQLIPSRIRARGK